MKIALVQNEPVQGDPGSSLADLDNLIGQGCGADIYVLPEMFATGQYIDPSSVVQTMDGQIVDWMVQKASYLNAAVCGSLPIKEELFFTTSIICSATPARPRTIPRAMTEW